MQPRAELAVLHGPLYAPLLFGREVRTARAIKAYLDVARAGIFVDA